MLTSVIKKIAKINKAFCLLIVSYAKFSKVRDERFLLNLSEIRPCLFDNTSETEFDRHYIYHTAWALRKLLELKPKEHYDFSSSLYFIGMASAVCKIKFHDYRPAHIQLDNVITAACDLTKLEYEKESIQSVSCMHVVEHVGLGRYGDPLNPKGDLSAISELKRVVKVGGSILFVVPLGGRAFIRFNANRVYTYQMVRGMFPEFDVIDFLYISDHGSSKHLLSNPDPSLLTNEVEGCGCFHFVKRVL